MSPRRRRGRKLVKDRDLAHLELPTDPEELTPAELAWVRLVLKQVKLPAIGTVSRDDTIVFANDPQYPSDGIAYIEPKMRVRP